MHTRLWELPYRFLYASAWEHRDRWTGHEHVHDTYEITFILEGAIRLVLDHCRVVTVSAGDLFLTPGGTHHIEETVGNRLVRKYLVFELHLPKGTALPSGMLQPVPARELLADFCYLFDTIYEEQDHRRKFGVERVEMCFRHFLLLYSRQAQLAATEQSSGDLSPKQVAIIRSATEDMENNLDSAEGIADIASRYSLTAAYFSTLFRRHHGVPPAVYLRHLRTERARDLLTRSNYSIQRIAEELGYHDPSHFCKNFKTATELTPLQYRKRVQSGAAEPQRRHGNMRFPLKED